MGYLQAIGSIILPSAGGWITGLYSIRRIRGKSQNLDILKKPSWSPPEWLFGPAWTILYSSMGYASYLVWEECGGFTEDAVLPLSLYGGQLILNWTWIAVFFAKRDFKLAFINILGLTGTVVATAISFAMVNKTAGLLMVPYIAWLSFASTLNYSIWKNNPNIKPIKEDDKSE